MFKKYHAVKQHDEKDCGAACLATVSKQYGLKMPVSKIRDIAGTDKQGTNPRLLSTRFIFANELL